MPLITGPAAIKIGTGPYLYTQKALKASIKTQTGVVMTDFHGELGKYMISRKGMIGFQPDGRISSALLAALFPLGVGNIGASVFGATDVPAVIWSKDGAKNTFARVGITQPPEIILSPSADNLFSGEVEVTALGAATTSMETSPTAAAHWQAVTSAAFTEATFDQTALRRFRYTAAYGDTPFDAINAQKGFKVQVKYETKEIPDDNVGIGDIILTSVSVACTFTPSNLNEAQLATLINLQGATALQPGDLIQGDGDTDLVITGTDGTNSLTVTLNKPGFSDMDLMYGNGELRPGEVQAYCTRTFASGVADPLFTFDFSTGS